MAEIVEYRIEKTLDELNLLVEFNIFTKQQAKEIIAKRENFEYTLRRRTRTKLDYLKYIRFEINLLESIEKYRKTVINDYKNSKKSDKLEEIERKILLLQAKKLKDVVSNRSAHISSLFRKLTIKFQFDKNLWLAYIEFTSKRKWNSRTSVLYWRLLRVAGNDEDLWLKAAAFEVEANKAYDVARGLYLRGLRHHPDSAKLWAEYFRMELKFMNIVNQRARIICKTLQDGKDAEEDIWVDDEPTEIKVDEDVEKEGEESGDEEEVPNEDPIPVVKPIDEDDAIISGHLPKVVYNNATKAITIKDKFNSFVCKIMFDILNSDEKTKSIAAIREHILKDLKERNDKNDPIVSTELMKACQNITSLRKYINEQEDSSLKESKRQKVHQRSRLDILYECYETKGIYDTRTMFQTMDKSVKNQTLSLYVGMIQVESWELKNDNSKEQLDRIRSIYDKALLKFGKTKPKLWYEYIKFENNNATSLEDFEQVNKLYLRAQATLQSSKVYKVIEKYNLMQVSSSNGDSEYSDYSDLED